MLVAAAGACSRPTRAGLPPLLPRASRARVAAGERDRLRSQHLPGLKERWRVLADADDVRRPTGGARRRALARAARRDARPSARASSCWPGRSRCCSPSLAGYGLAAAALRPVEAMRARAEVISASTPGARLPVPAARDEISRLAETLNEMLARLEAAFEHERRFVADASHELRTPLALLQTELELALRRPRSHDELERGAALGRGGDRTADAARRGPAADRARRSGRAADRRERVSAREVLEVVAGAFRTGARERGRSVEVAPSNGCVLDADPARLEQALGNLVDNALVHGGGSGRCSRHVSGEVVELHVGTRARFPARVLGSAFDRFSRADDARTGGGSGLGLSIVELIADAHDGTVGAAQPAAPAARTSGLPSGACASLKDASGSAHRPFISPSPVWARCSTTTWNHAREPRGTPA